ncbi:integrase family protein [Desulfofarcimen acetoxidans DSM 771]|uniref:Integrase family protein n=1 Tax=Desulfofarcimen acetoxidans (strain ATCC 49208 / DSM 771 / KCTC 5769 / VKM B-1644 / 5575) TaxID=485916 RepID=C8VZS8_DESAS|nr:tyrosine-type recombinase/integrase [Desulfofarcimen acetoxidans]ACV63056.1 integrase family protein [Desulfofarcimen acetoxidans DSM 771]
MKKTYVYRSSLAPYIEGLICQKRADGFLYEYEAYILKTFDDFCVDNGFRDTVITRELVMKWAVQRETEGINYRNQRVSFIRQLSLYMNSLGINSYIPRQTASTVTTIPHILSTEELKSLYHVIDSYLPDKEKWQRFSIEYQVIFRLYYCCGLRLAEVCNLKVKDVNLEDGILKIVQSKGNKDRLVYMADDVADLCRNYHKRMVSLLPGSEWFFPGRVQGQPIRKTSMYKKFKQFWNMTPFADACDKAPTIHALRHTFVVNRMNEWMLEGTSLNTMMPYLSRYLGHSSVEGTFYYYHQVDKAFQIVRKKDSLSGRVIPEVVPYEE